MSEEARITGLTKQAAFRISRELSVFDSLQSPAREQAIHQVMARVKHIREGAGLTVEGPGLIKEIIEEPTAEEPKVEAPVEEPPAADAGSTSETPAA